MTVCVRVCVRDVGLSCEWVAVMITARGESFQTCWDTNSCDILTGWRQSGIFLTIQIPNTVCSVCRTFLSAQGLSCSSVSVQAFRERRLWCTPTIHLKDSCLTETTSVFCHGPTQQERKKTRISSALWTSSWLGPISTTLDMCKTLLTVAHILWIRGFNVKAEFRKMQWKIFQQLNHFVGIIHAVTKACDSMSLC